MGDIGEDLFGGRYTLLEPGRAQARSKKRINCVLGINLFRNKS